MRKPTGVTPVLPKTRPRFDRAPEEMFFFIGEARVHNLGCRTFPGMPGGSWRFKFGGSTPARSFAKKKLSVSNASIDAEIIVNGSGLPVREARETGAAEIRAD